MGPALRAIAAAALLISIVAGAAGCFDFGSLSAQYGQDLESPVEDLGAADLKPPRDLTPKADLAADGGVIMVDLRPVVDAPVPDLTTLPDLVHAPDLVVVLPDLGGPKAGLD